MVTEDRTTGDIASLVEQAARELLEAKPTLKTAEPIERNTAIGLAFRAEQGSTARLMSAFRADASFGDLRKGWIQQRGGAGMPVQGQALPPFFVNKAIEGNPVESIVEEARAFAKSPTCATDSYTVLTGITVAEAVSLAQNIDLIPWSDVPESRHKSLFAPKPFSSFPAMRPIPSSAVRFRSAEGQVLFRSHKEAKASIEGLAIGNAIPTVKVDDLIRCVTALSVRHVAVTGSWVQLDKEIADAIGPASYMTRPAFSDYGAWTLSMKPVVLDGPGLVRLFQLFEEFKPGEKDVIRIALDRLSRALRGRDSVDNAIDLGIALEVMLLHGLGKNDRGELRYRSSVRGATFLGEENVERLEIFTLLKKAYDLRSKAVHTGVLEQGRGSRQILENAANTCAKIALKLIERRSFPNWDAEIVIGGQ